MYNYMTVRAKTCLVNTSDFVWLNLSGILHQAQIFSNDKVMSNLLFLQMWSLYVFPNKSYSGKFGNN